jgi:hypothetical protein
MRLSSILTTLSLLALTSATVTVNNKSCKNIWVAVAMDTDKNDGGYFVIAPGKTESWSRQNPGSTAFVVREGTTVADVEPLYIVAGQTLDVY